MCITLNIFLQRGHLNRFMSNKHMSYILLQFVWGSAIISQKISVTY